MVRAGLIAMLLCSTASATTVRGTVTLPPEPRSPDHDAHWRVENGMIAIGPRVPDSRTEVIVALEGPAEKDAKVPNTTTVSLHGLRLDPRVVVVPVGGTVEFKNDDRVPHTLYVEHATSLMKPEPTPAGQARSQRFFAAGEYRIRDEEYPHVDGVVLVLKTPYFARLDEKGQFKIELPEGKYTLRVFFRDRWVATQALEVGSRATEVTVQVPAAAMGAKL
jgi:plastocyanin